MNKSGFNEPEVRHGKVNIITFKNDNKAKENLIAWDKKQEYKKSKKPFSKKKKKVKKRVKTNPNKCFYKSREWLELRYRVLRIYQAKCMCCGRTPHEHGIVVNVDHIKPRSKYPELELDFDNMQILCRACNCGKSNIDNTNWKLLTNNDMYLIKIAQKMG